MKSIFRLEEDSLQQRFLASTAKIQIYGGGFANGKTSGGVVKVLQAAKDYPSANMLIARSTYPKLNDTVRKEFLKWCPDKWIKSFPKSANASNTCTLINGTTINFRYIAQQGKNSQESTTSNLLSATYDLILVDQCEDPEIVHKDVLDLLGRLRGMAKYEGDDPNMPRTGPRWLMLTLNPTRNWAYRKLVKPLHDFQQGLYNEDLMCETDEFGKPILDEEGLPTPIVEIFEGATYENRANLEPDFIKTLEATYKGQMRDRFLLGKWAAYEGLVYPEFSEMTNVISHALIAQHYWECQRSLKGVRIIEGYDYGMAVPYCYLLGFVDSNNDFYLLAGDYAPEKTVDEHIKKIWEIRKEYQIPHGSYIHADPDIFRRKAGSKKTVGRSIADMLLEDGIYCIRGNNDIKTGIAKIRQYLIPNALHRNEITHNFNSPRLFISDHLDFAINEFNDYYWAKDQSGDPLDKPVDKNDHAMDTVKYMFSERPTVATLIEKQRKPAQVGVTTWGEMDIPDQRGSVRYG